MLHVCSRFLCVRERTPFFVLEPLYSRMKSSNCPECRGSGSVECRECHGTGHFHFHDEEDEEKMDRDEACYACNGTGYVDCEECGGRGRQDPHTRLGFDDEEQFRDNML